MSNIEKDIKNISTEDLIRSSNISGGVVESEIQEELIKRFLKLKTSLQYLVNLKRYKDDKGKDEFYKQMQPTAWELANEALKQVK